MSASVVGVDGNDLAAPGVDLDVLRVDVDVVDQDAVEMLEVDLVEIAGRRGARGGDRLTFADARLAREILAVVEARRRTSAGGRRGAADECDCRGCRARDEVYALILATVDDPD